MWGAGDRRAGDRRRFREAGIEDGPPLRLGSDLGRQINGEQVIAAGHSYGANTTLLAAGARVERPGLPVDLRDARLRAAIVISAPPFYGESSPGQILAGVGVPSLHITGTDDVIRIPGYYSDASDRVAVFNGVGHARKTLTLRRPALIRQVR